MSTVVLANAHAREIRKLQPPFTILPPCEDDIHSHLATADEAARRRSPRTGADIAVKFTITFGARSIEGVMRAPHRVRMTALRGEAQRRPSVPLLYPLDKRPFTGS
ncbi:hypothetical protein HPB52_009125 [Rhipicephalus sanguineus]|uniref:Uncharacterized protein n=1 Tax=Rhipicephalus sanguineus TaxID=34632 RepID=A0A9D4T929_RHISA|nr:hypothetical protein HPB52_009125 [Rhipicephalus sanguineus]